MDKWGSVSAIDRTSSLCLHFYALVSFSNSKAARHLNKYVLDQKMYVTKVTLDHILLYSKRVDFPVQARDA